MTNNFYYYNREGVKDRPVILLIVSGKEGNISQHNYFMKK